MSQYGLVQTPSKVLSLTHPATYQVARVLSGYTSGCTDMEGTCIDPLSTVLPLPENIFEALREKEVVGCA